MRALLLTLVISAFSFGAYASGGHPKGSLIFKTLETRTTNKGKINRVTIQYSTEGATINVFTARAICHMSFADSLTATSIFQTIDHSLNHSVICSVLEGEINVREVTTPDFTIEYDRD